MPSPDQYRVLCLIIMDQEYSPEICQRVFGVPQGSMLRYLNSLGSGWRCLVYCEIQKYVGMKVDTLNGF